LKYDDLKPQKQLFVDKYLEVGDRNEAYRLAKYSIEGRGWRANARAMFLDLEPIIRDRIETRIGEGAIVALTVIKSLMTDKDVSPAVRLNACKDYLSRAGYDVATETKVHISDEARLSDSELKAEILRLTKQHPELKSELKAVS